MNKNEISCNTIIDLMPIYKENSCSEETRLLVEEHLSGCKSCRSLSEAFYVSEPVKAELPNEEELEKALTDAGFEIVAKYGDDTFDSPAPDCQRIVYAAKCIVNGQSI